MEDYDEYKWVYFKFIFFFKFCMCKEDMFKIFMDFNDRKLLNDFYLLRIKIIF